MNKEIKNFYVDKEALMFTLMQSKEMQKINNNKVPPKTSLSKHDTKAGKNGAADAIKNIDDIEVAKEWLLNKPERFKNSINNIRDYMLFVIGCNTARRIGDIIQFTFGTFMSDKGVFKTHFEIKEQKTGKRIRILINNNVKEAIKLYIDKKYPNNDYDLNTHLFLSRTQKIKGIYDGNNPITRQQAWNIYNKMGKAIGLQQKGLRISCHTPRKTWAYQTIKQNEGNSYVLTEVQEMLNHSSGRTTLRYAGIDQEDKDSLMEQGV